MNENIVKTIIFLLICNFVIIIIKDRKYIQDNVITTLPHVTK